VRVQLGHVTDDVTSILTSGDLNLFDDNVGRSVFVYSGGNADVSQNTVAGDLVCDENVQVTDEFANPNHFLNNVAGASLGQCSGLGTPGGGPTS